MDLLLRTERIKIDENSDTDKIDRKKLLDIIRRSPDMFFEEG